jgi:hypothetical protein
MEVFVLEMIYQNGDSFSIEAIGVYSSEGAALEAIGTLPDETDDYVYNIETFNLDEDPRNFISEADVMNEVKSLMDMGIVDQLIGEDGEFYYTLTEAGKEIGDNLQDEDDEDESWKDA